MDKEEDNTAAANTMAGALLTFMDTELPRDTRVALRLGYHRASTYLLYFFAVCGRISSAKVQLRHLRVYVGKLRVGVQPMHSKSWIYLGKIFLIPGG